MSGSLSNGGTPGAGEGLRRKHGWHASRFARTDTVLLRIHQQLLLGHVLAEAGPQERFVGRVLQQPPHQVRHARQQLAVGRVDADPLAHPHQHVLDRVGHAVEHLDLDRPRRHAQLVGHGQGVRDAADVVAAERRPQRTVVLQQKPRQPLVGGVGLPLFQPDRRLPAALARPGSSRSPSTRP